MSIVDLFSDAKMKTLITPSSLSCFQAREKFVYKTNLAFLFLGSGKIRLQNEFFLLYFLEAKVFNVIPWGDKDTEYE